MHAAMDQSSLRKRRRDNEDVCADSGHGADVGTPTSQQDTEFRFEDGTIILTTTKVSFRVYKGILAEHSEVFSDMFSLPQPNTYDTCLYHCPSVHLEDNPDDLRHVLRVLFPKKRTP